MTGETSSTKGLLAQSVASSLGGPLERSVAFLERVAGVEAAHRGLLLSCKDVAEVERCGERFLLALYRVSEEFCNGESRSVRLASKFPHHSPVMGVRLDSIRTKRII